MKNYKKIYVVIVFLLSCSLFSLLGFNLYFKFRFVDEAHRYLQDNRTIARYVITLVALLISGAFSYLCFRIAKVKGIVDPLKWAKYGFLFNVLAVIYLLFIEDEESS